MRLGQEPSERNRIRGLLPPGAVIMTQMFVLPWLLPHL